MRGMHRARQSHISVVYTIYQCCDLPWGLGTGYRGVGWGVGVGRAEALVARPLIVITAALQCKACCPGSRIEQRVMDSSCGWHVTSSSTGCMGACLQPSVAIFGSGCVGSIVKMTAAHAELMCGVYCAVPLHFGMQDHRALGDPQVRHTCISSQAAFSSCGADFNMQYIQLSMCRCFQRQGVRFKQSGSFLPHPLVNHAAFEAGVGTAIQGAASCMSCIVLAMPSSHSSNHAGRPLTPTCAAFLFMHMQGGQACQVCRHVHSTHTMPCAPGEAIAEQSQHHSWSTRQQC